MKQLLIEHFDFVSTSILQESIKGGGRVIVEGVIQRANAKNQNGRIYPKDILEKEIDRYISGPVNEKRALGELDHPDSQVINLKNVSHNIIKIWWDGDDVKASIEILGTPSGNILKELIAAGITVGISSRAMGSVQPLGEGTVEVQDDLDLLCWDFVSTPSTQGAFMKPVGLNENYIPQQNKTYSVVNELIQDIICYQTGICCIRQ